MIAHYVNQALWIAFLVAAPVVAVTMAIGLVLGFIQAVFQLQDQALPFGVKLVAVTLVLIALGSWQSGMMIQFSNAMIDLIATPGARHE